MGAHLRSSLIFLSLLFWEFFAIFLLQGITSFLECLFLIFKDIRGLYGKKDPCFFGRSPLFLPRKKSKGRSRICEFLRPTAFATTALGGAAEKNSGKGFCRNTRGISRVNFAGDFLVDFLGLSSLEKTGGKKSAQKSTAKLKSEFGSFAAKIHTARIWP